ncbi:beta-xylosidase [Paraburkholderia sp. BCC1884]|uniref:beta-xylosidase n=1 Tax=Paraburkholderia sp. BCC1884 TaxID=2562668 RepID=UPI0021B42AE5|nr:beta-xylosidase [Paraburkholderia sp. BCC1884]
MTSQYDFPAFSSANCPSAIRNSYCARKSNRSLRIVSFVVLIALGIALLIASSFSVAQITQGNGSSQQDNRSSAMGSTPDPSASMVHESNKPQTKDGSSTGARGKTAQPGHQTQGAGGFENGLYGTGAGSNK